MAVHVLAALSLPLVQARAWHRQVRRERAGAEAMAELARAPRCPVVTSWRVLPTVGDTVVLRVVTRDDGDLVVKVALSPAASSGLERHARALAHLADVDEVRSVVPELVAWDSLGGHHCVIERAAAGSPLTADRSAASTTSALHLMARVHGATAQEGARGTGSVQEAVDVDLARLDDVSRTGARRRTVARLTDALGRALDTCRPVTSVVHGDFWPGNVLGVGEPGRRQATAIVDWERASLCGLPELDLVHYLLDVHPGGFAAAVRTSLAAPETTVGEWLATVGVPTSNPRLGRKLCTVLAWLGHVGAGLEATRRFAAGPLWLRSEVDSVLDVLAAHDGLLGELAAGHG